MVFHTCLFFCQDLDQFMREMEEVHRQREAEKAASLQQRLSRSVASLPPPQPMPGSSVAFLTPGSGMGKK
jgi:hypothetical protein